MKKLQYDCACWGCKLPQWLPDGILDLANELYIAKHTIPVVYGIAKNRWHTCRDTPDVVVAQLKDGWLESDDEEFNARVQQDAEDEYKLRVLRQEREQCQP